MEVLLALFYVSVQNDLLYKQIWRIPKLAFEINHGQITMLQLKFL